MDGPTSTGTAPVRRSLPNSPAAEEAEVLPTPLGALAGVLSLADRPLMLTALARFR